MIINTKVCVSFNNYLSDSWILKRGVRQGGILSAFLFCFYIDDALKNVNNTEIGCRIGICRMNIQAYAEHTSVCRLDTSV